MAFDRKAFGMNSGITFTKIADRVEVSFDLKGKQVRGPRRCLSNSELGPAARGWFSRRGKLPNMSSFAISAITFSLVFGGALLGTSISARLPRHHFNADTKDVVRLGMGLVGTIVAITLGLLIGSAYSYFNNQTDELVHVSADVAALGRLLRHYGPEANGVHEALRTVVEQALENTWPQQRAKKSKFSPEGTPLEVVYDQLRSLMPKDDEHRMMKSEALSLLKSLAQMRWLILEQTSTTVLRPLLFVMIFSLTAIFVSWGLFSPLNATTGTTFFVAALCVSGAIFLILELYSPYSGLLRLSSASLRLAYESLRQ